jgi:pilus assembly protein CpaB
LKTTALPLSAAIAGAVSDSGSLVGLVLRYPLSAGEQLTPLKVGQGAKDDGIAGIIPTGKRAMAVEVSENTNVGGLIVAGNHVDVLAVVTIQDTNNQQISRGITLIQNVEVLSVAQRAQKPTTRLDKDGNPIQTDTANGSIATRPDDTSADPTAKTVTLAIDPADAPLLAAAQTAGMVYLAERGTGDDRTSPATTRTLPGQ